MFRTVLKCIYRDNIAVRPHPLISRIVLCCLSMQIKQPYMVVECGKVEHDYNMLCSVLHDITAVAGQQSTGRQGQRSLEENRS